MYTRLASRFVCTALVVTAAPASFPALSCSTYLRDGFNPAGIAADSARPQGRPAESLRHLGHSESLSLRVSASLR